ncbi:MAG: hypothetical protein QOG22_263 [Pseudonocardiales bacterium]|jgi:hypothetical protein|nr:hypothetical protein [Pseudonocardiales bacterium]MDT4970120.1 hypothetical protein [Pseudonocardiales bacterium]
MKDLVLPAFEMDCRDWLVLTPAQAGLPDEVAGSPLLAVLSTLVIGDDSLREASGVLTIGLLDDELPSTRPVARDCVAAELVDIDAPPDSLQYVLATPDGALALLAEFTMPDGIDGEIVRRIEMLMKSFRWAV